MTAAIDTLMLVDDSEIDQLIYARLALRSGIVGSLRQFMDAAEAFDYLLQVHPPEPDLILLDINMPGMNGFDFLAAVEARFGPGPLPMVAMLTSSLNPADRRQAERHRRVQAFLNKPLTPRHLAELGKSFGRHDTGDD